MLLIHFKVMLMVRQVNHKVNIWDKEVLREVLQEYIHILI